MPLDEAYLNFTYIQKSLSQLETIWKVPMHDFTLLRDKKDNVYLRKFVESDGESEFYILFRVDAKQVIALTQGSMSAKEAFEHCVTDLFYVLAISTKTGSMSMELVDKEDIEEFI